MCAASYTTTQILTIIYFLSNTTSNSSDDGCQGILYLSFQSVTPLERRGTYINPLRTPRGGSRMEWDLETKIAISGARDQFVRNAQSICQAEWCPNTVLTLRLQWGGAPFCWTMKSSDSSLWNWSINQFFSMSRYPSSLIIAPSKKECSWDISVDMVKKIRLAEKNYNFSFEMVPVLPCYLLDHLAFSTIAPRVFERKASGSWGSLASWSLIFCWWASTGSHYFAMNTNCLVRQSNLCWTSEPLNRWTIYSITLSCLSWETPLRCSCSSWKTLLTCPSDAQEMGPLRVMTY